MDSLCDCDIEPPGFIVGFPLWCLVMCMLLKVKINKLIDWVKDIESDDSEDEDFHELEDYNFANDDDAENNPSDTECDDEL